MVLINSLFGKIGTTALNYLLLPELYLRYAFGFYDVPPHFFPGHRILNRFDLGYGSSFLILRAFPVNNLSRDQGVPAPATTAAGRVRLSFPQKKKNPFPVLLDNLFLIKLVPARDASILFIEGMNKLLHHFQGSLSRGL